MKGRVLVSVGAEAAQELVARASSRRDRTSGTPLGTLGKRAVAEEVAEEEEEGQSERVR